MLSCIGTNWERTKKPNQIVNVSDLQIKPFSFNAKICSYADVIHYHQGLNMNIQMSKLKLLHNNNI